MFKNSMDFLNGAISIYMFLIIIRVFMSWFSPDTANSSKSVLVRLCDPYLNIFKKIGFNIGYMDFSPLAAIVTLIFAGNVVMQIGLAGKISFGIIISFLIRGIWTAISALVFFVFIAAGVRLFMFLVKPKAASQALSVIDSILSPLSSKTAALFSLKNSSYGAKLIILAVFAVILYYGGGFAVKKLALLAANIPF